MLGILMSIAELLMILLVALLVFGPDQLLRLARHLGRALAVVRRIGSELQVQFDEQSKEETLQQNIINAQAADEQYQQDSEQ